MRGFICCVLVAIFLTACGGKHEAPKNVPQANSPSGLTANEQRGINEITNFYGGDCTYSPGKTGVGTDSLKLYFSIQVSHSSALDKVEKLAALSTANIAITFYNSLEQERKNYDEIRSEILFSDGQRTENRYPVKMLDIVLVKMSTVLKVVGFIKDKNYDSLSSVLNDKSGFTTFNKKNLISEIKKADESLGNVKEFVPYGFAFFKTKEGRNILHISGVIVRDQVNNEFSVDIDPDSDKEQIIMISYKI